MNTFMGLEIGKRAIVTHQVALSVTGHNIANAQTPGYSRQAGNIVTTSPWHMPVLTGNAQAGQLGTGVEVADIQRYRNSFIDGQIRNESRTAGYWDSMQESLARIEGILNEPNEEGLRGVMDKYWKSWQDLSANPESESARSVVTERAMGMAESFNHAYQQLVELRDDVNSTVKVKTDEINSIALQIRDLNKQIQAITIAGKQPNDLMDKRDLLIDQLSNLVDIQVFNQPNNMAQSDASGLMPKYNGMVDIQLGGRGLVQGSEVCQLATEKDAQGMNLVIWSDTRIKANIGSGQLRGLLDTRGKTLSTQERTPSEYKEVIPTMIENLNMLARTIMEKTNDLHRSGYSLSNKTTYPDGTNFFELPEPTTFDGNWARSMDVDDDIKNDIRNIAAASSATWENGVKSNFGDGSKALQIAQLKHDLNRPQYMVQTNADLAIAFPSNALAGTLSIDYIDDTGAPRTEIITIKTPAKPYKDLQSLAAAIQEQLNKNDNLVKYKVPVNVRCDGKRLDFYSTGENFKAVRDGDGTIPPPPVPYLLGGSTFTAMPVASSNPLIQDATTDDFWRRICAEIGVQSQESQRMIKNQDTLIGELENKRQSLSGVNADEEMTNMIKFQHAYNAASRFITSMDEQLETIISKMGLVGR